MLAVVTGALVDLLGLIVLLGWILHIEALTRISPEFATMKFNTAVCLVLLGAALLARTDSGLARVTSLVVGAVATLSLAEYAFGLKLGIDQLLFSDAGGGSIHPGRMAVTTATCLLLAGIAVLALRARRRRLVTVASLSVFAVAWLGCLGYLFGVKALYNVGAFSTMSAPTAAAMVIVAIGLLAKCPDGPLPWIVRGDDPGATVLRRIVPLALVGVPLVGELRLMGQHAGWYGTEFGLALMVVFASSSVLAVAWHGARVINRSHVALLRANEQLHDLNKSLERRIGERTAELATSEAWSRTLADSAPVGIFHSNADGARTYVNDRVCEIYGITREEALGDAMGSGIHIEDRERVLTGWSEAIGSGVEYDGEFRVVQPSGATLWVRAHGAAVHGSGGGYRGSVGTVADITASHQAAAALQETEELFRSTFESSPVGLALVDTDGRVVRANQAVCALTGYRPDEMLGMRAQSILSPDDVGFDEDRDTDTAGADQRIMRADGSVRWASIRYAHIGQDDVGNTVLTMAQFVDTTERRMFEERLARLANRDSLTGLMNRRSFETALAAHSAHCKRYGLTGAVLMLDLDHFKEVNDSYGHFVGDQVIIATADRLRRRLRETDLIARLGGDEFVVLLPGADDARAVAQILVEEIHGAPVTVGNERIAITASIGVAMFDDARRSPEEMLVNADLAMYDAKQTGRDLWSEFTPGEAERQETLRLHRLLPSAATPR